MTGTGRDPTTCRNTPEQRRNQLAYQRARGRAVTALIAAHEAEWEHLFAAKRAEVQAEIDAVDEAGADHYGNEPARLKTGRRKQGQTVVDRIDVARCPHCIKHHDRGHVCAVCGAAPGQSVTQTPRRTGPTAKPPPGVDPAALAEFNAGTTRAAKAARR